MTIIVLSDTHGSYAALDAVLRRHTDADMILHLGDGEREVQTYLNAHPDIAPRFHYYMGNCDSGIYAPTKKEESLTLPYNHRLFATHGHRYGVKYSTTRLYLSALENHCNIALFGHTHVSLTEYRDGTYIINPGSAARPRDGKSPSYARIDVTDAGIMPNIVPV